MGTVGDRNPVGAVGDRNPVGAVGAVVRMGPRSSFSARADCKALKGKAISNYQNRIGRKHKLIGW
ncbi:hypothetical protein SAMN05660745_00627 [Corynebacterium glucuronolyticum]|nr:hypothetical protein CGLUCO_07295 [Corynebacterium glucuronolyticum DSM 44120]SMB80751.1 hypothetical protein SAMN05660745_00627 [Corynebacterium glucuronolyticum]